MPDWCKCFVLDRKSPPDFQANGPGMVVLTVAAQEKLKWAVADRMPWNHFGRKNLGFVYAALHGAEYIYDTDDDNFVLDGDARFLPRSLTPPAPDGPEGVQVHWPAGTGARVFNPYPFWGVDAWPRGFPLTMITNETTRSGALPVTAADAPQLPPRVCVLQSLANADPDVDAVHRLTGRLPLFFAPRRAWLAYPAGTYAPFNAQATLFDARALAAALALPVTVHGRVSDIWRSYIMQRAMWDMGCGLAFADPWVTQYRNAHKYLRDFQSELDLYLKTEGLLEVLGRVAFPDWTFASPGAELGGRVLALYVALYEHGLMEADDVVMLHAFLTDLGLMQPAVVDFALRVNRHAAEAAAAAKGAPGAPAAPQGTAMQPQQQPQLPAPKHRAAVCVTGVFRAGPFTLPHYQRNVLSRLGMPYDVFVSTPDLPDAFPHPSDYAYFLQPYKVVHANYSSTDELLALPGWERTEFSGDHYPSKWLGQLTDLSTCRDAIVASGAAYTHVVRLRADAVLAEPLPVPLRSLQPNELVVPDNEQWRGHNDRFAYGGFSSMVAYLSVVDSVAGLLERKQLTNAESALKSHLEAHGVTVLERPMHVCRLRNYAGGRLSCTGWDYITYEPCKSLCDAWHADVAPVQGGEAPPPSKRTWLSRMPLIGSLIILVIGVSCGAKHVWAPRFASRTQ